MRRLPAELASIGRQQLQRWKAEGSLPETTGGPAVPPAEAAKYRAWWRRYRTGLRMQESQCTGLAVSGQEKVGMKAAERQYTQLPDSGQNRLDLEEAERTELDARASMCVYWERDEVERTVERNLIRKLQRRQLRADDPDNCNSAQRGAEPEGYTQGETKKTADNAGADHEETTNVYTAVLCVRPASGGAVEISQDLEINSAISDRNGELVEQQRTRWQRTVGHGALNRQDVAHVGDSRRSPA